MPQALQKAKGTVLTVALLPLGVRQKPIDQTLIVHNSSAGTALAKGATSIPLATALLGLIPQGQWLLFIDSNGIERVCQLSADADAGASTLAVVALPETIADASTGIFPAKLQARTAASIARTAALKSTITFDSDSERDGTTTSRERNLSAAGNYLYYDAGLMTCEYAYQNDLEVWIRRTLPPPNSAYTTGKVSEGPAAITSMPDEAPADGFITENTEFAFLGFVTESSPVPKT